MLGQVQLLLMLLLMENEIEAGLHVSDSWGIHMYVNVLNVVVRLQNLNVKECDMGLFGSFLWETKRARNVRGNGV